MKASNLNSREQKVLWATVKRYIATAEPVGSKILAQEYDFDISAATIRNVLNMLDRSGLLYQPHTSAGRVPSDSGYRVYVDELIHPSAQLVEQAAKLLAGNLLGKGIAGTTSLELLLRSAAQVLATLSGCIALISAPSLQPLWIRHIHIAIVEAQKVIVTAISDGYQVASVVVDSPNQGENGLLEQELEILSNFLNAHLRDGKRFDLDFFLAGLQWGEVDRQMQQYAGWLEQSLRQITGMYNQPVIGQLFISGLTELLRQPEFTELSQVKAIVRLLEEDQTTLLPLMADGGETCAYNPITIRIGNEIDLDPIRNCTLISTAYKLENQPAGTVGLLGPTRLDYERAIASVQATATYLSEAIR